MATVTPIYYDGMVWCVSVPTGAFVARRNGHIFVTGNSGFPKATRIDTQVDKAAGAEREVVGYKPNLPGLHRSREGANHFTDDNWQGSDEAARRIEKPATPLASAWAGHRYGLQALKPAVEMICVAQKPYEGKPLDSITRTGAGALNIGQARIGTEHRVYHGMSDATRGRGIFRDDSWRAQEIRIEADGRWPANLIISEDVAEALDVQNETATKNKKGVSAFFHHTSWALEEQEPFFYCAKASRAERDAGLEDVPQGYRGTMSEFRENPGRSVQKGGGSPCHNLHPTVKPIALTKYLAALLLPPMEYAPRRILVPFAWVGSEMIGAGLAGWEEIVGIEMEAEYAELAEKRLDYWLKQEKLPGL